MNLKKNDFTCFNGLLSKKCCKYMIFKAIDKIKINVGNIIF